MCTLSLSHAFFVVVPYGVISNVADVVVVFVDVDIVAVVDDVCVGVVASVDVDACVYAVALAYIVSIAGVDVVNVCCIVVVVFIVVVVVVRCCYCCYR